MFSFFSSGTNGFFSCEFYQRLFRALIILFIALQISPLIIFDNSSFLGPFLQGFGWRATKAKVIMEERVVEEHIHLRTKRMILKWIFANDKLTKQQNCLMCDGKVHRRYVKHHRRSWPGDTLGTGADNQNGNLRWHLPGRGGGSRGSRVPHTYFEK